MQTIHRQKGVGMIEVLVALLLLAVGVLGFTALQLRAVDATAEAQSRIQAMNLARDLAERIRANRTAYTAYVTQLTATTQAKTASPACLQTDETNPCTTAAQMAAYDAAQVITRADNLGFKINMPDCPVASGSATRKCIYVAWGDTQAQDSTTATNACTKGGSYLPQARCTVMELY